MSRAALATVAVLGLAGCQTFIGIEDPEGHLPFLDGEYLVGLKRKRVDNTEDIIRLRGTATLDPDTRELRLTLDQLSQANGQRVAENGITGLVFDEDSDEVVFDMTISVNDAAITDPGTDPGDDNVEARMVLRAEGDYAFCAVPEDGATLPSIGSILVAHETPTPLRETFDTVCDDL